MSVPKRKFAKSIVSLPLLIILIIVSGCNHKKDKPVKKAENNPVNKIMLPIDNIITQKMKESGVVGLGAAIIVDQELVWVKGYGYADKKNKTPFTPNTMMCIASISKTFTGALLMKAVEDELLNLDEDINAYLPFKISNPYFPAEKITLRQLATHTSSLADDYDVYDKTYNYNNETPEALGDFLKNYFTPNGKYYSKKNFLDKKPGAFRDYSNIGAGLVGYIIETKTRKSLNEYGKEIIFDPLKMENTTWSLSELDLENHSQQYEKSGNTISNIPLYSLTTYPDGGIHTSVADLSRFYVALLNEGVYQDTRILKEETATEMLRFQFTPSNKPENVNLEEPNKNSGIFWATKRDVTLIGHGGSDFGVNADMFSDVSKDVGVILLSNTGEARTKDIFDELYKYGMLVKKSREKK